MKYFAQRTAVGCRFGRVPGEGDANILTLRGDVDLGYLYNPDSWMKWVSALNRELDTGKKGAAVTHLLSGRPNAVFLPMVTGHLR